MTSALYSNYIIDGVTQDMTPAEMLEEYLLAPQGIPAGVEQAEQIADETVDPAPIGSGCDVWRASEYLDSIRGRSGAFPVEYAAQYTKVVIAYALTERLRMGGTFRLKNIIVSLHWHWNGSVLGNMAAFYSSVQAACEYVDGLGIRIESYSYEEAQECGLTVMTAVVLEDEDDNAFSDDKVVCTEGMVADPDSWIVYVPLDDGDYRLGGSLLSQVLGVGDAVAPEFYSPDYFIDCYEVLREMVEDRIFLSLRAVGPGGLLAAVDALAGGNGARINVSDLMRAQHEEDAVRVLFAEVPGVVFQISDEDFDYIDAEFTLQEVMFFPLGHPEPGRKGVKVETAEKNNIQNILDALIRRRPSEGED